MRNISDDELDKLFRDAAQHVKPEFDPQDWEKLSNRIDRDTRTGRYKRAGYISLALLLLLASWWGINKYNASSTKNISEVAETPGSPEKVLPSSRAESDSDAISEQVKSDSSVHGDDKHASPEGNAHAESDGRSADQKEIYTEPAQRSSGELSSSKNDRDAEQSISKAERTSSVNASADKRNQRQAAAIASQTSDNNNKANNTSSLNFSQERSGKRTDPRKSIRGVKDGKVSGHGDGLSSPDADTIALVAKNNNEAQKQYTASLSGKQPGKNPLNEKQSEQHYAEAESNADSNNNSTAGNASDAEASTVNKNAVQGRNGNILSVTDASAGKDKTQETAIGDDKNVTVTNATAANTGINGKTGEAGAASGQKKYTQASQEHSNDSISAVKGNATGNNAAVGSAATGTVATGKNGRGNLSDSTIEGTSKQNQVTPVNATERNKHYKSDSEKTINVAGNYQAVDSSKGTVQGVVIENQKNDLLDPAKRNSIASGENAKYIPSSNGDSVTISRKEREGANHNANQFNSIANKQNEAVGSTGKEKTSGVLSEDTANNTTGEVQGDSSSIIKQKADATATQDQTKSSTADSLVAKADSVAKTNNHRDSVATEQQEEKKEKSQRKSKWFAKLVVSPDFSAVGYTRPGKPGTNIGLLGEYSPSGHWGLSIGAIWSKKLYGLSDPGMTYSNNGHSAWATYLDGDCRVLDIPINVTYYIMPGARLNVYATVGASSYLMLRENYTYTMMSDTMYEYYYSENYKNKNNNWFSMLNLSIGIQYRISERFLFQAEPFLKAPVSGVGQGKIDLVSLGSFFTLKYQINK
ncbi:MAG TPA: hypothetical protein VIN08_25425 [Ohtaekwangia sp.]|uniref:outer membrane beta-barrel protein n=1 Tax=Ohtaekwangia sp. TaxID=2066019 RepID=UPI002F92ADBC